MTFSRLEITATAAAFGLLIFLSLWAWELQLAGGAV